MIRSNTDTAPKPIRALAAELAPLFVKLGVPCYIAGGCLRDAMAGLPRKDVDIFFPTEAAWKDAVFKLLPAHCLFLNQNAMGLETTYGQIDLCRNRFVDVESQLRLFDFTACCAAITSDMYYVRHERFEADARARQLIVHCPASAGVMRAMRFVARGWSMDESEVPKLLRATTAYPPPPPSYRCVIEGP
jgi:hypothetical protein